MRALWNELRLSLSQEVLVLAAWLAPWHTFERGLLAVFASQYLKRIQGVEDFSESEERWVKAFREQAQ